MTAAYVSWAEFASPQGYPPKIWVSHALLELPLGKLVVFGVTLLFHEADYSPTYLARPDGDLETTGWVAVPAGDYYATLDEASADDNDFCWTATASATLEVSLSDIDDPLSSDNHVLSYRGIGAYTVYLLQGAVEIASWVENDAELTTHQRLLSGAQADSITDYSDLNVQVVSGS